MYFTVEKLCKHFISPDSVKKEEPLLWVLPGTIVYWLREEQRLVAVELISTKGHNSGILYLDERFTSAVVDVHIGGGRAFVTLENATVHVYDQYSSEWTRRLTFQLRTPSSSGGVVKSIAFHENQEFVCWCESHEDSCVLLLRSLPSLDSKKSFDQFNQFTDIRIVLTNAPQLSLKCVGYVISAVPKVPVSILMTISTTGPLRLFNVNGKPIRLNYDQCPVNFWGLLKNTIGLWDASKDYVVSEHINFNQRVLSYLTKQGTYICFSDKGFLAGNTSLHLPEESSVGIVLGACLYSRLICVFFTGGFCVYSTEDGRLVQNSSLNHLRPVQGFWSSKSVCTLFGFYTSSCIYRLQLISLTDILNSQNSKESLLSGTKYTDSAFLTTLQVAVNTKQLPPHQQLVSMTPPLQSHALLLALMQHCHSRNIEERTRIIQSLNQSVTPGTRLDRHMRALVNHFLMLEKCRQQLEEHY